MKKWTYLVATLLLGATVAFTSCVNTDEPEGIKEMRGAKAELLRAKALVAQAEATAKAAEATLTQAQAEVQKAIAEVKKAEAEVQKAAAEAQRAQTQIAKDQAAVALQESQAAADEAQAKAEAQIAGWQAQQVANQKTLEQNLRDLAALELTLTTAETKAIKDAREYVTSTAALLETAAKNLKTQQTQYLSIVSANNNYKTEGYYESAKAIKQAAADMEAAKVAATEASAELALKVTTEEWDEIQATFNDSIEYYKAKAAADSVEIAEKLQGEEFQALEQAYKAAIEEYGVKSVTGGNIDNNKYVLVAEGVDANPTTGATKAKADAKADLKKQNKELFGDDKVKPEAKFERTLDPSLWEIMKAQKFYNTAQPTDNNKKYKEYLYTANPEGVFKYNEFTWDYPTYAKNVEAETGSDNMYKLMQGLNAFVEDLAAFKADPDRLEWMKLGLEDKKALSLDADTAYMDAVAAWEFQADLYKNGVEGKKVESLPTTDDAVKFNNAVTVYNNAYKALTDSIAKYNKQTEDYVKEVNAIWQKTYDSLWADFVFGNLSHSEGTYLYYAQDKLQSLETGTDLDLQSGWTTVSNINNTLAGNPSWSVKEQKEYLDKVLNKNYSIAKEYPTLLTTEQLSNFPTPSYVQNEVDKYWAAREISNPTSVKTIKEGLAANADADVYSRVFQADGSKLKKAYDDNKTTQINISKLATACADSITSLFEKDKSYVKTSKLPARETLKSYLSYMKGEYGVISNIKTTPTDLQTTVFGKGKYKPAFNETVKSLVDKTKDSVLVQKIDLGEGLKPYERKLDEFPVLKVLNNAISDAHVATLTAVKIGADKDDDVLPALKEKSVTAFGSKYSDAEDWGGRLILADIEEQLQKLCEEDKADDCGLFGAKYKANKEYELYANYDKIDELIKAELDIFNAQIEALQTVIDGRATALAPYYEAIDAAEARVKAAEAAVEPAKNARDAKMAEYDAVYKADQAKKTLYTYYLEVAKDQYKSFVGNNMTVDEVKAYWAGQVATAQQNYEVALAAVEQAQKVLELFQAGESPYAYEVQYAEYALEKAQADYAAAYAEYQGALARLANVLATLVAAE